MSKKKKNATNNTFHTPASFDAREKFEEKAAGFLDAHAMMDNSRGKSRMMPVTPVEGDTRRYRPVDEQSDSYQAGRQFGMQVIAYSSDAFAPKEEPVVFSDDGPTFTIGTLDALAEAGMLVDEVAAEAHRNAVEHAAMRRKT